MSTNYSGAPVIIGTAGHIDHGKTTLVKALTGQDADRLPEEKARGITIDLGFAHMSLENGQQVAFIDVPGHEKFVRNMVAGVHGMDGVLLVVAADEGIMPQTREHLDILTLLGVEQGITVITKADMVDGDMLELVQAVTRDTEEGTFLQDAPMIVVDGISGRGISELRRALEQLTHGWDTRQANGVVRLPIDRVFTVKGFGTVVTGTLVSGVMHIDDSLELVPGETSIRVRGLEVHNQAVREARAGQRVAANLSGVDKAEVQRGQILASPGKLHGQDVAQVAIKLLEGSPVLKEKTRVHVHSGTAETLGRVYFFDRDALLPGNDAYAELRLETPMPLARGDRLLLRAYSPVFTIGGGEVLEVGVHHRRKETDHLSYLAKLHEGDNAQVVADLLKRATMPLSLESVTKETFLSEDEISALDIPEVQWIPAHLVWHSEPWMRWQKNIHVELDQYLARHPLKPGMPLEELKTRAASSWTTKVFHATLEFGPWVVDREWVRHSAVISPPSPDVMAVVHRAYQMILQGGLKPPHVSALQSALNIDADTLEDVMEFLILERAMYRLEDGLWIAKEPFAVGAERVTEAIQARGPLGTSDLKEVLGVSRKMAVLFLELLDKERVTRRIGDQRTLVS